MFTDLCIHDSTTFWPHRSWPEFERWPEKESTLVLCPVTGHTDWALGHPADAEELIVTTLLRHAAEKRPAGLSWLMLPPCRFAAGSHSRTSFPVPLETAFAHLSSWGKSVAESGFRRLVFINASPFTEDIIDAAGRDLRADHDLQVFIVNLAGLGLDLHPRSPAGRLRAQTLLTAILGKIPVAGEEQDSPAPPLPEGVEAPWEPDCWPMPDPLSVDEALAAAPVLLDEIAGHFIRLALEIRDHPPLP